MQVLTIEVDGDFINILEVHGLGSLQQFRELKFYGLNIIEVPNLSGLKQLHHLKLNSCKKLSSLQEMGHLPALQHFDLHGCRLLLQLPNLKKFTTLRNLEIGSSGIELREEDIQMLMILPMLRPVKILHGYPYCIMLDIVRRKVFKTKWLWPNRIEDIEEERDLELLPIKNFQYQF